MSANKRIPSVIISYGEQTNIAQFDIISGSPDHITYDEFLDYYSTEIGYTFQETEERSVISKIGSAEGEFEFLSTEVGKWYKITHKEEMSEGDNIQIGFVMEETTEPEPEPEPSPEVTSALEFATLTEILTTIAHQIGVEKQNFSNKFEIIKSIFDKFTDGRDVINSTSNDVIKNILYLVEEGLIQPSVTSNKLTYDGNIWKFERMPDTGAYVAGDLYLNSSKIGTYNGFVCRNTLSNWEEAALSITSASFGNQSICLMRENNGDWKTK